MPFDISKFLKSFLVNLDIIKSFRWRKYILSWLAIGLILLVLNLTEQNFVGTNPPLIFALVILIFLLLWWLYKNRDRSRELLATIFGFVAIAILIKYNCLIIVTMIPALIAVWPDLYDIENRQIKKPYPGTQINLLIWFLIHLNIGIILQFNASVQSQLQKYPSVVADNFSSSTFVDKVQIIAAPVTKGEIVLQSMEREMRTQIDRKPWPQAKQKLQYTNMREKLGEQEIKKLEKLPEKTFWKFETELLFSKSGYNLELKAKWRGLGSNTQGYNLNKLCQIYPVRSPNRSGSKKGEKRKCQGCCDRTSNASSKPSPVPIAQVECQPIDKQIVGKSNLKKR